MAKYDDRTARGWPLPHKANRLYDDVERLREALNQIDATISGVETHEGVIEDKQDSLETRLDTILEGATEESEILDARVDAQDNVHPNLGHNLRNLHRLILGLGADILYEISEFDGLLRQFNDLVHAQLRGELNSREAHERRKFEIQQEVLSRFLDDLGIQSQVDLLAENDIKNASARKNLKDDIRAEIQNRKQDENAETFQRDEFDEALQEQVNQLAKSSMQNSVNFRKAAEQRRELFARFIQEKNDRELQIQTLRTEIGTLYEIPLPGLHNDLDSLHNEAEDNSQAILRNTVNIVREINMRRETLSQEALTRNEQIEGILQQTNQLAHAVLRLAIQQQKTNKRVGEIEIEEAVTPGQVAKDSEFDEMLEELYSNTNP